MEAINTNQPKELTIREVLDMTVKDLEAINIPQMDMKMSMVLTKDVLIPVYRAIENLHSCLNVIPNAENQAAPEGAEVIDLGNLDEIADKEEDVNS